jgi:rhamnosyl/mannosyltransferase
METAVKDICESLISEVDLDVLVANSGRGRREDLLAGIRVTRLANLGTLFSQLVTPGLFGELRRRPADIIHLHEPNPLALACFLASRHPAKLVIHYHSDIVRQRRLFRLYLPILERGLARAEAIVVGSPHLVESSAVLGRWREKCVVVPFGIDLDPFLALPREAREPALPQVLAVGRLIYYKGFHHLIEAVRTAPVRLVIAGDGEMRTALERQIAASSLGGRVRLAGRVTNEELLSLYANSDIVCLPSCERSEAFGLALVEGMAAGLPVISTDLPTGVRLVNQVGVTGIVVPPGDAAHLSQALTTLAHDPALRWRFGAAGRERARLLFGRAAMGRAILDIYRGLLESPSGAEAVVH